LKNALKRGELVSSICKYKMFLLASKLNRLLLPGWFRLCNAAL
jgi:hypothetical protein